MARCIFCTEDATNTKVLAVSGTDREHELFFCDQHWPSAENEMEMSAELERKLGLAPHLDPLTLLHRIDVAEVHPGDIVILHVDESLDDQQAIALVDLWNKLTDSTNRVVVFAGGVEIEIKRPVVAEGDQCDLTMSSSNSS